MSLRDSVTKLGDLMNFFLVTLLRECQDDLQLSHDQVYFKSKSFSPKSKMGGGSYCLLKMVMSILVSAQL